MQALPNDTATLVAGMTGPDSLSSSGSQVSSYQPAVSFHIGSFSSASQVSPVTIPAAGSFSQLDVPPPIQSQSNLTTHDRTMLSSDNLSNTTQKRRRLSKISRPDTTSTSRAAQYSNRDRQMASLELSHEPQPKSEQQRQILEKAVHALGYQQRQDGNDQNAFDIFSDTEWVKVSKALAGLLREKHKSLRLQQRHSNQKPGSNIRHCDFEDCDFSGRPCDLRKHSKRHQRPYGCTYPKCHKKFGAKSDWKRHENSQHYQLEAFRCDYPDKSDKKCGYHCCRSIQLQNHLAEKHNVTSASQVQTFVKRCRIGKNCQGQYWCGFCNKIEVLETSRNDAWDERFNHIAFHFEKEERSIDEWLCVEENKTKKELHDEVDRGDFADATEMGTDADVGGDSNEPSVNLDDWSHAIEETAPDSSGTRNTTADQRKPQCSTPEEFQQNHGRFCVSVGIQLDLILLTPQCACGDGPAPYWLQDSCSNCAHRFCRDCSITKILPTYRDLDG